MFLSENGSYYDYGDAIDDNDHGHDWYDNKSLSQVFLLVSSSRRRRRGLIPLLILLIGTIRITEPFNLQISSPKCALIRRGFRVYG